MTVRPIDMLTMIPRLNEANKIQHQKDFQPILAQQSEGAALQARNERAQRQVREKEAAEEAAIRRDRENRQGGGREREEQRKGAPQPSTQGGKAAKPASGHHLDVKV